MKILVIGSSNVDINVMSKNLPKVGETLMGKDIRYSYGGKGANQAIACGKLGADVMFLTSVGDDNHGQKIQENLAAAGVNVERVKVSKSNPTGSALITIDDAGQNTIVVIAGANYDCDIDYLKENDDAFEACDFVLLQMEIPLEAIEYAIKRAHHFGKKIILNPAPALPELSHEVYAMIDYFTPNETELEVITQSLGHFETMDHQIDELLNSGIQNLIITQGDKGAYFVNKEIREMVPAFKVEAIDTVGAGDCFNGAFVSALAQHKTEVDAITFANRASSIAVTREGAQTSIPTLDEMNEY